MKKAINKINELKENDSKFIQVYVHGEPYLMFAPKEKGYYHGFMLEEMLKLFDIEFNTFKDKSLFSEIPLIEDLNADYRLVGAGKACHLPGDRIKFWDFSGSYNVGTNLKHLEEVFKDKKPKISETQRRGDYIVDFRPSEEISEVSIKSNLKNETISDDEVPF